MIDPKELRIGNFLRWNDRPVIVAAVLTDGFIQCEDLSADRKIDEFEAIPLTPEIAKACRFEHKPNFRFDDGSIGENWLNQRGYILGYSEYGWGLQKRDSFNQYSMYHVTMQHLHQLQNLYFALTGRELSVNLPQ